MNSGCPTHDCASDNPISDHRILYPYAMPPAVHQKGANGLVAEYECVVALHKLLDNAGYLVEGSLPELEGEREAAISRVANELTEANLQRAINQGQALATHIFEALIGDPENLGIFTYDSAYLKDQVIGIRPVGRNTNSGSSADLVLIFSNPGSSVEVPISLKAYGERPSSLGSKSARASLCRIFLASEKVSDDQFRSFFEEPGADFLTQLADFKASADEFYASPEGRAFVREYQQRKGDPNASVNNPLRRKEVGEYFRATRGYMSEHKFAELYVQMFNLGLAKSQDDKDYWASYLVGLRFVLGMDNDILTLNAVADEQGKVLRVENSYQSEVYGKLRKVLTPGCEVQLSSAPQSSIVRVLLSRGHLTVKNLSLAVWKDATIQFKLNSRTS